MPLFDYICNECGKSDEILVIGAGDEVVCRFCGSKSMKKLLSAHSSMSGITKNHLPGLKDTGCCGSSPAQANCAGPGSCCGKSL